VLIIYSLICSLFDNIGNLPQILKNPTNITILSNETDLGEVSFECITTNQSIHTWLVIAPNKDPIYYKNPGLTAASSQLLNLTLTMNGTSVYCKATNASGSVTSTVAILTILGTQILNAAHGYMCNNM